MAASYEAGSAFRRFSTEVANATSQRNREREEGASHG